jgi:hypothetical protein
MLAQWTRRPEFKSQNSHLKRLGVLACSWNSSAVESHTDVPLELTVQLASSRPVRHTVKKKKKKKKKKTKANEQINKNLNTQGVRCLRKDNRSSSLTPSCTVRHAHRERGEGGREGEIEKDRDRDREVKGERERERQRLTQNSTHGLTPK